MKHLKKLSKLYILLQQFSSLNFIYKCSEELTYFFEI